MYDPLALVLTATLLAGVVIGFFLGAVVTLSLHRPGATHG